MSVKSRIVEYFTSSSGKQPVRDWLDGVKDKVTQAIIYKRIRQAGLGNFGKARSVGGGTKRTQQSDIEKTQMNWNQWKVWKNES